MSDRKPIGTVLTSDHQRVGMFLLDPTHPRVIAEMERIAETFEPNRVWVHKNGEPYRLSDRVWDAGQTTRAEIDTIVKQAMATGEDALITAKRLEQYLDPSLRPLRNPTTGRLLRNQPNRIVTDMPGRGGKGSYAARRLMRTEISAAHAQATRDAALLNPFAETLGYRLSAQHPGADPCDALAERDVGWGPGNYPIRDCPLPPTHPSCICFTVVNVPTNSAAVVDALRLRYGLAEPTAASFVFPSDRAFAQVNRALTEAAKLVAKRLEQAAA